MKTLDNQNERARKKALEADDVQPYHKRFIDFDKACPHCDEFIRRNYNAGRSSYMDNECKCSFWSYQLYPYGRWYRKPKSVLS